jgi:phage antirepressor YoqD-like protein
MSDSIVYQDSAQQSPFDAIRGYRANGSEYWTVRELMKWLGYIKWDKFITTIEQAIENLELSGNTRNIHVVTVTRMGKGNGLEYEDYEFSRLACYHVALACTGKGKPIVAMAKQYFASKARDAEIMATPTELSHLEILQLALASEKEKLLLEAQIEADRPATELGKAIGKSISNIWIGEFAKSIGIGQNRYFRELRECGIIMASSTLPYQRFLDSGYFVVTQVVQGDRIFPVSLVTPKGQAYLASRHQQHNYLVRVEAQIESAIEGALV